MAKHPNQNIVVTTVKKKVKHLLKKFFSKINQYLWTKNKLLAFCSMGIGFFLGIIVKRKFPYDFHKNNGQTILILAFLFLFLVVIYLQYQYLCKKELIEPLHLSRTALRYLYYAITFLLFSVYYALNNDYFLHNYKQNSLGIPQVQYIFLVNFVAYFLLASLLYYLVISDYSLKKVGRNGIEIEIGLKNSIRSEEGVALDQLKKGTKDFSNVVCEIEQFFEELKEMEIFKVLYSAEEFANLIDEFLQTYHDKNGKEVFFDENKELTFSTVLFHNIDEALKENYGFRTSLIHKIKHKTIKNKVFCYNNILFIRYEMLMFHKTPIMIIVNNDKTSPGELGVLVYTAVFIFENLFSKHTLLNQLQSNLGEVQNQYEQLKRKHTNLKKAKGQFVSKTSKNGNRGG